MKILHIIGDLDKGGGPRHVLEILNYPQNKFDHYVFSKSQGQYISSKKNTNLFLFENFFSFKSLAFIYNCPIGTYHFHGFKSSVYLILTAVFLPRKKIIYTPHGISRKRKLYHKIGDILFKLIEGRVSSVIAVGPEEKETLDNSRIFSPKKIKIILNGTPIIKKLPSNYRAKIVHVTRYDYQKNSEELLNICNDFPKENFEFFGAIPKDKEIPVLKNVSHNGNIRSQKKIWMNAKIYVNTSRWEGLSLAVLEALSYGTIIILSDCPGNKIFKEFHSTSILFYESGNVLDLKRKLKNAIALSKTQIISKENIYIHRKYFSTDKMINELQKEYQK